MKGKTLLFMNLYDNVMAAETCCKNDDYMLFTTLCYSDPVIVI